MHQEHDDIYEHLLSDLSALCGIASEYWDVFGTRHVTSLETRKAVLRAMGFGVERVEDLRAAISSRADGPWRNVVDPVHVLSVNGQPVTIPVFLPVAQGAERDLSITWSVRDEQGGVAEFVRDGSGLTVSEERWINGVRYVRVELGDGVTRDIGYYDVSLRCRCGDEIRAATRLIIAPDRCFLPPGLSARKVWGLSVNLYALRSGRNWGIGDFTDLARTLEWVCSLGGSFVGVNPLHAIPNTLPYGVSPYSPISRIFRNFVYLDVERIPDVMASPEARELLASPAFAQARGRLRQGDLVDYQGAASLKEQVLRPAFAHFMAHEKATERGRDFARFREEEGAALQSFALYMALRRQLERESGASSWQEWPPEFCRPDSAAVRTFRSGHESDVLFYEYLQWLTDRQLEDVAAGLRPCDMAIGVYQDLAIGAVSGGSDVWAYQDVMAADIDVGAPPDDFNPLGQNWGFPPAIPGRLREQGYELLIRTVRNAMDRSGALRIDHALGMFRLFWIPRGRPSSEGAYVTSPADEILRIIALESVRNRCAVVAEDLGTVGPDVRDALRRFGMLSMRLLYFERDYPEPSFLAPDRYPELAACAVTTHDLPTLCGYWEGKDIDLKERLGICRDAGTRDARRRDRQRDKALLIAAMEAQGIVPPDFRPDQGAHPQLPLAVYGYLAKTPCTFVIVSLDDVIGTADQQNMPGTIAEYPNWRQKTPLSLEAIMADKRFVELADMFRQAGRTAGPSA